MPAVAYGGPTRGQQRLAASSAVLLLGMALRLQMLNAAELSLR